MVFVDFSNAFLRSYLADDYCFAHERILDAISDHIMTLDLQGRGGAAAVLDIDEVILSNIHMNVYQDDAQKMSFFACDHFTDVAPDSMWPRGESLGPLLPGARRLIRTLLSRDITIYFVTGRDESLREETIRNFIRVGLGELLPRSMLEDPTRLIMSPRVVPSNESIQPWKEAQRKIISESQWILLNIGDQASDLGLYGDIQALCPHPFYFTP